VWETTQRSHNKEAYYIRRLLTEGAVRASDKRAQFVGIEAYEFAGGVVMRDLFQQDDGGWLQDPVLLDRLVVERLDREAQAIRAEGWKWLEVATDFPYGHTFGLRHVTGEAVAMTDDETASAEALRAEYERLEHVHAQADELPDDVDRRLGEIETALAALDDRPVWYDPEEIARAGVFVSIDSSVTFGSSAPTSGPKTSRRFPTSPTRRRTRRVRRPPMPGPMKWSARSMVVRQNRRTSRSGRTTSSLFRIG
jgi:ParB family chromosome partitioning protein